MVLYDTAALASGFYVDNVEEFSDRMYRVLSKSVGISEVAELVPEIDVPEDDEEEEGVEVDLEDLVAEAEAAGGADEL